MAILLCILTCDDTSRHFRTGLMIVVDPIAKNMDMENISEQLSVKLKKIWRSIAKKYEKIQFEIQKRYRKNSML